MDSDCADADDDHWLLLSFLYASFQLHRFSCFILGSSFVNEAIAAATLLRAVAIAASIAQATVVRLRLVAQAIAGIATGELGPCKMPMTNA